MSESISYFECHITMEGDPSFVKHAVSRLPHLACDVWKFSQIDGDIVLGGGTKCYATRHFKTILGAEEVMRRLKDAASTLDSQGCKVVRRKVELVIYDDRSTKVNCTGGCPDCHLDDFASEDTKRLDWLEDHYFDVTPATNMIGVPKGWTHYIEDNGKRRDFDSIGQRCLDLRDAIDQARKKCRR